MYQGHNADGSSIQNHSTGAAYPFMVGMREAAAGLRWFVMGPSGDAIDCAGGEAAQSLAVGLAQAKRAGATVIQAEHRRDLGAMTKAHLALQAGASDVRVLFADGADPVAYTQRDRGAVMTKLIFSI